MPTDKGGVCVLDSTGVGGCVPYFSEEQPIYWYAPSHPQGDASTVYGLVPNEITDLDIVTNTGRHNLSVRRNAFFWEATAPTEIPVKLLVRLPDGSRKDIRLGNVGKLPDGKICVAREPSGPLECFANRAEFLKSKSRGKAKQPARARR